MKKIKNLLFMFIGILVAFFVSTNISVSASQRAVIGANDLGVGSNIYDGVQYTKSRDISVTIYLTDEEVETFDPYFDICEITVSNNQTKSRCSTYQTTDKTNTFQIISPNDGEKTLEVRFYSNYANKVKAEDPTVLKIVLDTTGPVIELTGGEYVYLQHGQTYSELGAVCTDDSLYSNGECIPSIGELEQGDGRYSYVTYEVEDFLGNQTIKTRKILVEQEKEKKDYSMLIYAGIGIAILAGALFVVVLKNKEKQKNQSVL